MRRRSKHVIPSELIMVALLATISSVWTSAQPPERLEVTDGANPLTVCDVLKEPSRYRGRLVTVTGIFWAGLRQSCPEPFVTREHTWPSALNLAHSQLPASAEDAVSFKTDEKSWDDLLELVRREGKARRHEEIWVTITGQIRAPAGYIRKDGQIVGGYGHLGVFPAELVVKRILGTSIKSNPTYDYGELLRHVGPR